MAITRKGLFPMFMATNFHFNTEFPSVSPFPSFFFPLPFRFFLSFFFSSSYSGFNPFLGRWKKKEEKKEGALWGPFERASGLSCYKPGFPEVPFTPFALYTLFGR